MKFRNCCHLASMHLCLAVICADSSASAERAKQPTDGRIDQSLASEVFAEQTLLAPQTDDATFLRRIHLDLVGDIPTPLEVTAFVLDPSQDKRNKTVNELLAREQFGQNWARYFRDAILSRRVEERALQVSDTLVVDLTQQLNGNRPWDEIARQFISATGDVRENGATAIIMAQDGRTEETVAEISRLFLGIQIQCAQCHDHPYDSWSREQFHELAAFFPRVGVRQIRTPTRRSFSVYAVNRDRPQRRRPNNDRIPTPEHFMPDLNDPKAAGTLMTPEFFLTGASLELGTTDAGRRKQLADWITSNEWFAKALVNRLWSELVGEGFFEPIDDIGPERQPTAGDTLDLLAEEFANSGYDVKWLLRTICATDAYQRESRSRRGPRGVAFAANVPQPLRADQLFNALLSALELDETVFGRGRRGRRMQAGPYGGNNAPRAAFNIEFNFDPSDLREEISASIPQVLAIMNSPQFASQMRANGTRTMLGRLIEEFGNDSDAIVYDLYLRCLSREPTPSEQQTAVEYVNSIRNRDSGYEDVLWALLNSAEFRYRR